MEERNIPSTDAPGTKILSSIINEDKESDCYSDGPSYSDSSGSDDHNRCV